jgi:hypothetical protein
MRRIIGQSNRKVHYYKCSYELFVFFNSFYYSKRMFVLAIPGTEVQSAKCWYGIRYSNVRSTYVRTKAPFSFFFYLRGRQLPKIRTTINFNDHAW